jgi:hypothetical protein
MTMRKLIVEGDPLKTGGIVLPSGATQSYNGYPVAYIGGMVTCFVCGVTGPIIKAGGGRRFEVAGGEVEILFGLGSYTKDEEVAMEDDEVVCACPKHPQLLSVLSPTVMYDDEMSPLGYTGRVVYTAGADLIGGIWSLAKGTVNLVADQATLVVDGPLGAMGVDSAQQAYDAAMKRNLERVETAKALPGAIADKVVDVWHNPSQLTQAENVGHIAGAVVPVGAAARLGKAAEIGAAAETVDATVLAARARQAAMLEEGVGYNISPTAFDRYDRIGQNGTFVTDQTAIVNGVGPLNIGGETRISAAQVAKLEQDMGLAIGSLNNGFKVRQVDNLSDLSPRSPLGGNSNFTAPGQHLPGGAPEMVIDSIPTTDGAGVKTLTTVIVE